MQKSMCTLLTIQFAKKNRLNKLNKNKYIINKKSRNIFLLIVYKNLTKNHAFN